MPFAIVAEYPLGTYRGHVGDGEIDAVPSPARLVSALLCAAAQGPRAQQDGDLLVPCEQDLAALRWLETHPPDAIGVPEVYVNHGVGTAFRTRLLETRAGVRRFARSAQGLGSVAVNGAYSWIWHGEPPTGVRAAIEELCADVSHLGMAESPVRLRIGAAEPTHELDSGADWWGRRSDDLDLDVPEAGRTAELVTAYRLDNSAVPTIAKDRLTGNETHVRPRRVKGFVAQARYASQAPTPPQAPWTQVLLSDVDQRLTREADRVKWAVAVHRALIKIIGLGAPSVLTGKYAEDVPLPANRCAIQVLAGHENLWHRGRDGTSIALLIPAGIDPADFATVAGAWRQLSEIHPSRRFALRLRGHRECRADRFWTPPPAGYRRLWSTMPAAVPETRGQGREWTFADAAALSVGMVLRERLGIAGGRGGRWYRDLAARTRTAGLNVQEAVPVQEGDLSRFVHKVPPGTVLRPYRARLDLDRLIDPRTLLAIGQNRHLGNGLLVPVDVPQEVGHDPEERA
jgi:CRISPR-associated protein Csb2